MHYGFLLIAPQKCLFIQAPLQSRRREAWRLSTSRLNATMLKLWYRDNSIQCYLQVSLHSHLDALAPFVSGCRPLSALSNVSDTLSERLRRIPGVLLEMLL